MNDRRMKLTEVVEIAGASKETGHPILNCYHGDEKIVIIINVGAAFTNFGPKNCIGIMFSFLRVQRYGGLLGGRVLDKVPIKTVDR